MPQTTITNLDQVLKLSRQRQDALQPFDLTDQMPMYEFRWPDGQAPTMVRLTQDRVLSLSPRAEGQLLQRLGVPAQFFRKLPTNLRWAVGNHFVQNGGFERNALLRTVRGTTVRALLTETYTPLDDVPVLEMLADVIGDDDLRIEALSFEDDFTHLRIVFPRRMTEVRKGDVVMTGLNVTNSETGCRAVHIDALVYRLVCSNGLVRAESNGRTTLRHVGQAERLKDAMAIAIRDAKENAHRLVEQFKATIEHKLTEPQALLERFAQDAQLSRDQLQAALAAYALEPDPTGFGVVNAVTRAAQFESSFKARYQMERQGAALLARLN
ncbi:MAG TPA: DUF932 domain-containing protein [Oscillatoriaceae cyanobacterium]